MITKKYDYIIVDSMGKETDIIIQANNIKDAQKKHKDMRVHSYGKVKRVYTNGNDFQNRKK